MKKIAVFMLTAALSLTAAAGCSGKKDSDNESYADEDLVNIEDLTAATEERDISSAEANSVLLILDEPEKQSPYTFMLMFSDPQENELRFSGIPANSVCLYEDSLENSISDVYEKEGVNGAVSYAEIIFGTEIDRYMVFNTDSLSRTLELFGDVEYPLDAELKGFSANGSVQTLSPDDVCAYILYPLFRGGEAERAKKAADIVQCLLDTADRKGAAEKLEDFVPRLLSVVNTDISQLDFYNYRDAIVNMLESSDLSAEVLELTGMSLHDDFIPDEDVLPENMKRKDNE